MSSITPTTCHLAPNQRWSTASHATARIKATIGQTKAPGQVVYQSHGTPWTLPQTYPAGQRPMLTPWQATPTPPAAASNPHSPILNRRRGSPRFRALALLGRRKLSCRTGYVVPGVRETCTTTDIDKVLNIHFGSPALRRPST